MPMLGLAVTSAARAAAHLITLIIDLIIIGGMCVYVTYKAREKEPYPTWFQKWGPTLVVWISLPLILADPIRHVAQDNHTWKGCKRRCGELWPSRCDWSSAEYHCTLRCDNNHKDCSPGRDTKFLDCTCVHDSQETMKNLSFIGVLFTVIFTYFGYALFMFGALWSANILEKCRLIRHQYRVYRGLSEDSDLY